MKTTQICTTIEQSKRLLELGLNLNTADMSWTLAPISSEYPHASLIPYSKTMNRLTYNILPAWSLHRLIAMLPNVIYTTILSVSINYPDIKLIDFEHNSIEYLSTSGCRMFHKNKGKHALYNNIIDCIEWLIQEGHFNKEYLKEK